MGTEKPSSNAEQGKQPRRMAYHNGGRCNSPKDAEHSDASQSQHQRVILDAVETATNAGKHGMCSIRPNFWSVL